MSPQERRQQLIRLIHVGKRDLNLDDDTYRSMLRTASGGNIDSSSKLSLPQLADVLDVMKQRGFKIKVDGKPVAQVTKRQDPQETKIRALWLELHTRGYVLNPSEASVNAYVKRITRIERMEWLSTEQASQVIETLKKWLERDFNKILKLRAHLEMAGKASFQTVDQICMQVTGSHELTKQHAEQVITHLEGLINER